MSSDLAINHADHIERISDCDERCVWALRLNDCEQSKRQWLIDHHESVRQLLVARGRRIASNVVHADDGEFLTLRVVTGPAWH